MRTMVRPGCLGLLLLAVFILVPGYRWWSAAHGPIHLDAGELVLQPPDLPAALRPVPAESQAITDNPYADITPHYRSGYRAVFAAEADREWGRTRVVSTTFVLSRQGAEDVHRWHRIRLGGRGRQQPLPPLGRESLFIASPDEPSAPLVIVGVVRVDNVLITLTVMTDRDLDAALVHGWARTLVERARAA